MTETPSPSKPTIVLVHGAFAESASWNGVISGLLDAGCPVLAVANPLRGVHADAAYLASVLDSLDAETVLVAHSYGGMITSNVNNKRVRALVYVGAFAPDAGDSAATCRPDSPAAPWPRRCGRRRCLMATRISTFAARNTTHNSQPTRRPRPPRSWPPHNARSPRPPWKRNPPMPLGGGCPPGFSLARKTATFRSPYTGSWPSGPDLAARSN